MTEAETFKDLSPWLIYLIVMLGTFAAFWVTFRAEKRARKADISAIEQNTRREAEAVRNQYIQDLEGTATNLRREISEVREQLKVATARISTLEVSEENCQRERITLLAENATLRRENDNIKTRIEALEAKNRT